MENLTIPVTVIAWTMAAFALVKGLADFFAFVSTKTANTVDDNIMNKISKILGVIGSVLDQLLGNTRPKI